MPKESNRKKKKIKIAKELRGQVKNINHQEKQVIIHCIYKCKNKNDAIRISDKTFLTDGNFDNKFKLVHITNITLSPKWFKIKNRRLIEFTLVFEGIPNHWEFFHLVEDIDAPNRFMEILIDRNKTDVYHLTF